MAENSKVMSYATDDPLEADNLMRSMQKLYHETYGSEAGRLAWTRVGNHIERLENEIKRLKLLVGK